MNGVADRLWVVGSLMVVASIIEVIAVGAGSISTYLMPLGFGAILLSRVLAIWFGPSAQNRPVDDAEPGVAPDHRPRR